MRTLLNTTINISEVKWWGEREREREHSRNGLFLCRPAGHALRVCTYAANLFYLSPFRIFALLFRAYYQRKTKKRKMIIEFFNKKNSEVEKDLAYPFMQKKALMEK